MTTIGTILTILIMMTTKPTILKMDNSEVDRDSLRMILIKMTTERITMKLKVKTTTGTIKMITIMSTTKTEIRKFIVMTKTWKIKIIMIMMTTKTIVTKL